MASRFDDWEYTMGAKLQQWRLADRRAHAVEMFLRGFGTWADHAKIPAEDVAHARELREAADRLFDGAMAELQLEIRRAGGQESRSIPPLTQQLARDRSPITSMQDAN